MPVALLVGIVAMVATLGLTSGASGQVSAGQQPIDFAEGSFRLPSQYWSVPQRDLGRYAGGAVQAVRQVPGHDLLLNVQVKGAQASSADGLLATLVSANSESAGADWMVDFANAAPRNIDGRDYPSLTQRQHDDATGETLDIIDVWVFPSDFDARHRVVGISIVDRRPSQVDPIPLDEIDAVVGSLDIRPVGTV